MTCALCGQPIDETTPAAPTADGGRVHIACGDRVARSSYRRRMLGAAATALLLICALLLLAALHTSPFVLLLAGAAGLSLHVILNRRWWRYIRTRIALARMVRWRR